MPVDRPTFSESWYRVAELRPRLRSTVQISRQYFRGQLWHVVQDPASNQFFRLNDPAYHLVALLDGRRTVAKAWGICNEQLGDAAPTQGETIRLLGQLYTSNLLHADLPPDTETLFQRYRQRVGREVRGYLMNLLFVHIPLFDPDHLLNRWVGVVGRLFSMPGLVAWAALVGAGLYSIAGRGEELVDATSGILDPQNLPLLYASLVLVKVFHEFGHAFACKRFGRIAGTGGEVHVIGVMLLIFTPLPYMDASSAWTFRQKWHRAAVGAAGMMVELAVAAVAAVLWANTSQGTTLHAIAYNAMFIAGVSTILFNANPLLRYDGYYILSDLLEMPNMAQRSKEYLYYLVRRYAWGVRGATTPANTETERVWLAIYGIASTIYRVVVCVAILLFVADKLFFVGVVLAVLAATAWVVVPAGKFAHYLATSGELYRVRGRAVVSTLAVLALVVGCLSAIPAPDRYRIQGVAEPARFAYVHVGADGFVSSVRRGSGERVNVDEPLLILTNPALETTHEQLVAGRLALEHKRRLAQNENRTADAQVLAEAIAAADEQLEQTRAQLDALTVRAPVAGEWVAPDIKHALGKYVRRGDRIGLVASVGEVLIRGIADQASAGPLHDEIKVRTNQAARSVEIRVRGSPDLKFAGVITNILDAGRQELPSAALGYLAGGSIQTAADDTRGTRAAERFFEVRVAPQNASILHSGQRVIIRASLPARPLVIQWWQAIQRLFQRRFQV